MDDDSLQAWVVPPEHRKLLEALAHARRKIDELDRELGGAHMKIAKLEAELDEERNDRVDAEVQLNRLLSRLTGRSIDPSDEIDLTAEERQAAARRVHPSPGGAAPPPGSTP